MNPITKLLGAAYTADKILDVIAKHYPKYRKGIQQAISQGYTPEQISGYLEKEFSHKANTKEKKLLGMSAQGELTDFQRTRARQMRSNREDKIGKAVIAGTLGALGGSAIASLRGGGAAASGLPQIAQQLPPGAMPLPGAGAAPLAPAGGGGAMGGMGQVMQNYAQHLAQGGKLSLTSFMKSAMGTMAAKGAQTPPAAPMPQGPIDVTGEAQWSTPGQPAPQPPMQQPAQPMQAPAEQAAQAVAPITEPESKAALQQEGETILDAMKLKPTIESLVKAGNQPEVIADLVNFKMSPGQKAWVKEQNIDVPSLVKGYADKIVAEQGTQPEQAMEQIAEPRKPMQSESDRKRAGMEIAESEAKKIETRLQEKYPDLTLHMKEHGDQIKIDMMKIPESQRGQGTGTKVLNELIDYADENGKTIYLTPESITGDKKLNKRLDEFYKRHGFVKNRDLEVSYSRMREPEPSKATLQPEERKPLAAGSTAFLPNGDVGTITSIEGNKVRMDVGGEKKIAPTDHVIQPPPGEAEKELTYRDYVKGVLRHIPESEKSAILHTMYYDPKSQTVFSGFLGQPGKIGTYRNVPPEVWAQIESHQALNKTSGETAHGAEWKQGDPGLYGASVNQLLKAKDASGNLIYPYENLDVAYNLNRRFNQEVAAINKEEKPGKLTKGKAEKITNVIMQPPSEPKKKDAAKAQENLKEEITAEALPGISRENAKVSEIAFRPDLMQFKKIDVGEEGLSHLDEITGNWDPLKAGIITVWEPKNPKNYDLNDKQKFIVVNGHHRLSKAKKSGVGNVRIQVLSEADGISAGDARSLGAEINIADGKGTIHDQVKFLREQRKTHGEDEALGRARQIGAKGRDATTIAFKAEDNLYSAFVNERITAQQAAAIADAAPNNDALQTLGVNLALKGKSPQEIANFIQVAKSEKKSGPSQEMDLFSFDDSAIKSMEVLAKKISALQNEVSQRILSISGAVKRPEKAKEMGADIRDIEASKSKLAELRDLKTRLEAVGTDRELMKAVKEGQSVDQLIGKK